MKTKSRTRVPGVHYTAENDMQVVDSTTFSGGVGFTVSNERLSVG